MNSKAMLEVRGLEASVAGNKILHGINCVIFPGEIHAIMGPNGSGKSTFAKLLAGDPSVEVSAGEVFFEGHNLLDLSPEDRALKGIFLAFQYPVEIPGVNNAGFMRMAYNVRQRVKGLDEADPLEFDEILKARMKLVEVPEDFLERSVNHGFSGGEKKRNEILQMALLEPKLAILDETDSGLDVDALRVVASGINQLKTPDRAMIVVTHYERLLKYLVPDFVHVLVEGKIVASGNKDLAEQVEREGFDPFLGGAESRSNGTIDF